MAGERVIDNNLKSLQNVSNKPGQCPTRHRRPLLAYFVFLFSAHFIWLPFKDYFVDGYPDFRILSAYKNEHKK